MLSVSLYLIYRLTIFPSSHPALHYRNMIRWIVFMSFSCSWMECTNWVYFRVLFCPSFHWKARIPDYALFTGGHLIWLRLDCFPTAEFTEGHTLTFFGKQTGCLHIKSKREKGKNVLWASWDAAESTSWEKCFLLRRVWTLK